MVETFSTNCAQGSFIGYLSSSSATKLSSFQVPYKLMPPTTTIFEASKILLESPHKLIIHPGSPSTLFNSSSLIRSLSLLYSSYPSFSSDQSKKEKFLAAIKTSSFSSPIPSLPESNTLLDLAFVLSQPQNSHVKVLCKDGSFFIADYFSLVRLIIKDSKLLKTALSMTLDEACLINPLFLHQRPKSSLGEISKALYLGQDRPLIIIENERYLGTVFPESLVRLTASAADCEELYRSLAGSFEASKKALNFSGDLSLCEISLSGESTVKQALKAILSLNQYSITVFEATDEIAGVVRVESLIQYMINFPLMDHSFIGNNFSNWHCGFLLKGFSEAVKRGEEIAVLGDGIEGKLELLEAEIRKGYCHCVYLNRDDGKFYSMNSFVFVKELYNALVKGKEKDPDYNSTSTSDTISNEELLKVAISKCSHLISAETVLHEYPKASEAAEALQTRDSIGVIIINKAQEAPSLIRAKDILSSLYREGIPRDCSKVNFIPEESETESIESSFSFAEILASLRNSRATELYINRGRKKISLKSIFKLALDNLNENKRDFGKINLLIEKIDNFIAPNEHQDYINLKTAVEYVLEGEKVGWVMSNNKQLAKLSASKLLEKLYHSAMELEKTISPISSLRRPEASHNKIPLNNDKSDKGEEGDFSFLRNEPLEIIFNFIIYVPNLPIKSEGGKGLGLVVNRVSFLKLATEAVFKGKILPESPLRYMLRSFPSQEGVFWSFGTCRQLLDGIEEPSRKELGAISISKLSYFLAEKHFMSIKPSNTFYRLFRKLSVFSAPSGIPVLTGDKKLLCVLNEAGIVFNCSDFHNTYFKDVESILDRVLLVQNGVVDQIQVQSSGSEGNSGDDEHKEFKPSRVEELKNEFFGIESDEEKLLQYGLEHSKNNFMVVNNEWSVFKVMEYATCSEAEVVFLAGVGKKVFGKIRTRKLFEYVFGMKFLY